MTMESKTLVKRVFGVDASSLGTRTSMGVILAGTIANQYKYLKKIDRKLSSEKEALLAESGVLSECFGVIKGKIVETIMAGGIPVLDPSKLSAILPNRYADFSAILLKHRHQLFDDNGLMIKSESKDTFFEDTIHQEVKYFVSWLRRNELYLRFNQKTVDDNSFSLLVSPNFAIPSNLGFSNDI